MSLIKKLAGSKRKRTPSNDASDDIEKRGTTKTMPKARHMSKNQSKGKKPGRTSNSVNPSNKRKRNVESVNELPWKRISSRHFRSEDLGDDAGMLEIDEVSDVEVVYEEEEGGRVAKFRVSAYFDLVGVRNG